MIRFVNLDLQISEEQEFAFYNTETGTFFQINGSVTWTRVSDFVEDYKDAPFGTSDYALDRFLTLIPKHIALKL